MSMYDIRRDPCTNRAEMQMAYADRIRCAELAARRAIDGAIIAESQANLASVAVEVTPQAGVPAQVGAVALAEVR